LLLLSLCNILSDERMILSFTLAASPRQRSHSGVRVPRDSWPHFTVSDSRLLQPGGPGPRIYFPQEQGGPVIPPGTGDNPCESESYVTTDVQSASLSWNKAPIWGLRPDFYYCQAVAGLLMWGALSDEGTGLSFTIATGSRQRCHSRARVSWYSRTYFTLSDSRLLFMSSPTTRRPTVEHAHSWD
jgi:hypothetical protein